ncbi:MAG: NUDIX domain-containing protein [Spirochaetes bacterium]|nr:NUDIX domain-containing protein [Spirochaetota bacterium]
MIIHGTLAFIKHENKILLIKREKEPYLGYWGLIGGKMEFGETIMDAVIRETIEETGLEAKFKRVTAFLNEVILNKKNKPNMQFILFICEVIIKDKNFRHSREGMLKWFDLKEVIDIKDKVIPSDYKIITNINKFEKTVHIEASLDQDYRIIDFKIYI